MHKHSKPEPQTTGTAKEKENNDARKAKLYGMQWKTTDDCVTHHDDAERNIDQDERQVECGRVV